MRAGKDLAFLGSALATDPARPLLTFYDDATGERTELSAATLGNWVVKTANLLVDGCGLDPGDRAAVLLPPHWQTAAVLLGSWTAGLAVDVHLAATAGLPRIGSGAGGQAQVAFVSLDRLNDIIEEVPAADHQFVLGLAPLGAPLSAVPDGYLDYIAEARSQPDQLMAFHPARASDPATTDGTSYEEWGRVAQELAATHRFSPGDRVLVDAAEHEHPAKWLLAPMIAGATIVLCANLDPAAVADRTRAERITRVL
jgi:uncharacterized protein (TIGR03089 family)